jgi:antitoxin YefM
MAIETTYTRFRANLAKLLDEATKNRETIIIRRRGAEDVALVAADELASLEETAYLLRSPRNAQRLLEAVKDARARKGKPQSLDDLKREVGL